MNFELQFLGRDQLWRFSLVYLFTRPLLAARNASAAKNNLRTWKGWIWWMLGRNGTGNVGKSSSTINRGSENLMVVHHLYIFSHHYNIYIYVHLCWPFWGAQFFFPQLGAPLVAVRHSPNQSIFVRQIEFFSSAVLILKQQLVKTVLYGNKKLSQKLLLNFGFYMLYIYIYIQFASIYVHNKSLYTCSDSCLRFILCLHFMPGQYVALGGWQG